MPLTVSPECTSVLAGGGELFLFALFFGLGISCCSIIYSLLNFVAQANEMIAKGKLTELTSNILRMLLFVICLPGLFLMPFVVRFVKINVPDVSGFGLIAFIAGAGAFISLHLLLKRLA